MQRRDFLQRAFMAGVSIPLLSEYNQLWGQNDSSFEKLTILHTNDTHSRIDPFDSGEYKGLGGIQARKILIDQVRKEEKNVLLLDAGDIFQGTPYFNLFNGELEMKSMSYLGYDAGTMGNHDFDSGIENFHTQMQHANFPFIVSNYNFKNTALENKILPYKIFQKGKIKIGVIGIGIELEGLVNKKNYGDIQFQNPIDQAQYFTNILKYDEKCHIIIALSHLGFNYINLKQVSDQILAQKIDNLDIIIGGHTHTFLACPKLIEKNNISLKKNEKKFTIVNQVGFGGINLGKLDIYFNREQNKIEKNISNLIICKK